MHKCLTVALVPLPTQASTAVGDTPEVFRSFLSSISAAAARGVINELAWQTIQARILRHAAQSAAMTLQTAKTTASASGGRKSGVRSVDRSNTRTSRAASVTMNE